MAVLYFVLGLLGAVVGAVVAVMVLRRMEGGRPDGAVQPSLQGLEARLARQEELAIRMEQRLSELMARMDGTVATVAAMRGALQERARVEDGMAQAVGRLERLMAGARSKGEAGEMVVEDLLAKLPAEWVERNVRFGNRVVEFALRLPAGRLVPIDSKWPASNLLSALGEQTDPAEARRIRREINDEVLRKAQEVSKYVDDISTPGFGIAVVPDPVFDVSLEARARALSSRVAVVSHSLLLPYVLLVMNAFGSADAGRSVEPSDRSVEEALKALEEARHEVEGRLSKGLTMVRNGAEVLRALHLKAISHLEAARKTSGGEG